MKKFSKLLALLLCVITLFSIGLTGCKKEPSTTTPSIPGGDGSLTYMHLNTLGGKTAKQIYNSIVTLDMPNYSYEVNYTVFQNSTLVLPTFTVSPSYKKDFTIQMKKAGGSFFYEVLKYEPKEQQAVSNGLQGWKIHTTTTTLLDNTAYVFDRETYSIYVNEKPVTTTHTHKQNKLSANQTQLLEQMDITQNELFNPLFSFSDDAFIYDGKALPIMQNNQDAEDVYFQLALSEQDKLAFSKYLLGQIGVSETSASVRNMSFSVLLKSDGSFEKAIIKATLKDSQHSSITDYDFNGSIELSNIGSTVVSIPSDADEYN